MSTPSFIFPESLFDDAIQVQAADGTVIEISPEQAIAFKPVLAALKACLVRLEEQHKRDGSGEAEISLARHVIGQAAGLP